MHTPANQSEVRASVRDDSLADSLAFSNAVLKAWLLFARQDEERFTKLLQSLEVDLAWIENEVEWHSVEFHERFLEKFASLYGADSINRATQEMYARQGFRLGQSALGLLLAPQVFLSALPRVAKRMNHYSRFSFVFTSRQVTRSSGVLIQEYRDPDRQKLNAHLCESCVASTEGVFASLGYTLLAMTENKCVKRGDPRCEYRVEWVNRISLSSLAAVTGPLVLFFLAWIFDWMPAFMHRPIPLGSAFALALLAAPSAYVIGHLLSRRRLHDAFEYQQETLDRLRQSFEMQKKVNQMLVEYQGEYEKTMALAQIGEISYGIIHDMASPISLIRLSSDLIDRKMGGDPSGPAGPVELQNDFALIKKSTTRLVSLQNLLRRAVIQDRSLNWVEVDLSQLVTDAAHLYRAVAMRGGIELQVACETPSRLIRVKESYAERALINLMHNAINALRDHPKKKIAVSLRLSQHEGFVLSIEDSGPGIPRERIAGLFEKLGRSSGSQEKEGGQQLRGTGWGLYSIRSMMNEMEGDFVIETGPTGTKATLIFPASLIVDDQRSSAQSA